MSIHQLNPLQQTEAKVTNFQISIIAPNIHSLLLKYRKMLQMMTQYFL